VDGAGGIQRKVVWPAQGDRNLSTVCHHLALVAVDGASDEVALTLCPTFELHTRCLSTDRWGYLALLDANRALSSTRSPLDVVSGVAHGAFVSVGLVPRCLAHFRLAGEQIAELWLTRDWSTWQQWLRRYDMG
jgi:hypothetical protein